MPKTNDDLIKYPPDRTWQELLERVKSRTLQLTAANMDILAARVEQTADYEDLADAEASIYRRERIKIIKALESSLCVFTTQSMVFPDEEQTAVSSSKSLPLGLKNENPWNIKALPDLNDPWEGQVGVDARGHSVFSDAAWAARATLKTLRNMADRVEPVNLMDALNLWAPVSDTHPQASNEANTLANPNDYSSFISNRTGLSEEDAMDIFFGSHGQAMPLAENLLLAMAVWECGAGTFDEDEIRPFIRGGISMFNENFLR